MSDRMPFEEMPKDTRGVGMKFDGGKAPVMQGAFQYFPRALLAVAQVSDFGAKKYAWGSWKMVPDALNRYEDGHGRHTLLEFVDGPDDPESKLLHKAHRAWNALATLELYLMENEKEGTK